MPKTGNNPSRFAALNTGVVCEKDNFDTHDIGMGRVYHSMYLGMKGRGKPIVYWATMSLYNGGKLATVITKAKVIYHRDKYSSNWQWTVRNGREDSSIWGKNFDAMAQNLCIKKLLKYFPFDMNTIGIGDTDFYEDVAQDSEEVVQRQVALPQVSEE